MKKLFVLLALSLAATGCISSVESDVNLTPAPDEDAEYNAALTKATKERTVFKDFETRYKVTATYLSPEFRAAFTRRLERVYKQGQVQFEEANAKAGFFVSMHAPGGERTDLTNPHHWSVLLASKDGPLKPVLVKRINDKERWRAFFPAVAEWTEEYLIVFDAPSVILAILVGLGTAAAYSPSIPKMLALVTRQEARTMMPS
jgi:hypothetical protein